MKKILLIASLFVTYHSLSAQSEINAISDALNDYIEGSTNGQPKRLEKVFHSELNLYAIKENKLTTWSGKDYILDTKEGQPTGEAGKIISIDYENNVAVAKVEISHPESINTYVDYFLLLKVENKWTIIHKAYTKRLSNKIKK